jgi:hypothetical protein
MMSWRKIRWKDHVAHMRVLRSVCKVWPEYLKRRKRPYGGRRTHNGRIVLEWIVRKHLECIDWIHVADDRDQW